MTGGRTRWEIADDEWRMERFVAEAVDCERCGARGRDEATGRDAQHCRNTITDTELRAPAHPGRIAAGRRPSR